jgi:hypothetical protein
MDLTPELIRSLYQSKIEAARRMSFTEKFMAGPKLFDQECEVSMAEIRREHPDIDEAQVLAQLRRRLEIRRQFDERPYESP